MLHMGKGARRPDRTFGCDRTHLEVTMGGSGKTEIPFLPVAIQEVVRTLPGAARLLRTAAALCCAAAGIAGCASGTSGSQPPARTDPAPSAPSSPPQPGDPQALARAAYL